MTHTVHRQSGCRNLVMAGGVALNCVANGKLLREGPFDSIWIQPAAGDAGGSLGSALFVWHQLLAKPREPQSSDSQNGSFLGPSFSPAQIHDWFRSRDVPFRTFAASEQWFNYVARILAEEKIIVTFPIGWRISHLLLGILY